MVFYFCCRILYLVLFQRGSKSVLVFLMAPHDVNNTEDINACINKRVKFKQDGFPGNLNKNKQEIISIWPSFMNHTSIFSFIFSTSYTTTNIRLHTWWIMGNWRRGTKSTCLNTWLYNYIQKYKLNTIMKVIQVKKIRI